MTIKQHIQQHVSGFSKLGLDASLYRAVYEKGEEFKHGVTFFHHADYSEPNDCYCNAASIAMQQPEQYWYCEGFFYSDDLPLLIQHAWLVSKSSGRVYEPTLKAHTVADEPRNKLEYMGIVLRDTSIGKWLSGYYGLFDATDYIESLGYPTTRYLFDCEEEEEEEEDG